MIGKDPSLACHHLRSQASHPKWSIAVPKVTSCRESVCTGGQHGEKEGPVSCRGLRSGCFPGAKVLHIKLLGSSAPQIHAPRCGPIPYPRACEGASACASTWELSSSHLYDLSHDVSATVSSLLLRLREAASHRWCGFTRLSLGERVSG